MDALLSQQQETEPNKEGLSHNVPNLNPEQIILEICRSIAMNWVEGIKFPPKDNYF